jgi:hypothetical protein
MHTNLKQYSIKRNFSMTSGLDGSVSVPQKLVFKMSSLLSLDIISKGLGKT